MRNFRSSLRSSSLVAQQLDLEGAGLKITVKLDRVWQAVDGKKTAAGGGAAAEEANQAAAFVVPARKGSPWPQQGGSLGARAPDLYVGEGV